MLKTAIGWICLLAVVVLPAVNSHVITDLQGGANGGVDCAVCSLVLGMVDHLTIVYNESAAQSLERLCSVLPEQYKAFCKAAVDVLGNFILFIFLNNYLYYIFL